jgi:tRNA (Thr-GGU) A37 N-methylase
MTFAMSSVGSVRSARRDPANSDHWGQVTSTIVIDERFGANCLAGLAEFSHVEVLFVFDQARERDDYRGPRSPRGGRTCPRGAC